MIDFGYRQGTACVSLKDENYYIWDSGIIKGEDGLFHLFTSRWEKELGFGWNWLFNSRIIHSVSKSPEGPFEFSDIALDERDERFFDGRNTHNTCIRKWNGKYYLYYMGTTYSGGPYYKDVPAPDERYIIENIWNHKRIGVAVSDSLFGPWKRLNKPLLDARPGKWDQTAITNPAVAILKDGTTYMIYKSRFDEKSKLQLGIAKAPTPIGPFERISDDPIHLLEGENTDIEDPYLWYDEKKKKFCMIAKDNNYDPKYLITDEWGSGFYAESDDCIHFELGENPKVYSRHLEFKDGTKKIQCNLERPTLLFDSEGNPTHIFLASGDGKCPYSFEGTTYVVSIKLERK